MPSTEPQPLPSKLSDKQFEELWSKLTVEPAARTHEILSVARKASDDDCGLRDSRAPESQAEWKKMERLKDSFRNHVGDLIEANGTDIQIAGIIFSDPLIAVDSDNTQRLSMLCEVRDRHGRPCAVSNESVYALPDGAVRLLVSSTSEGTMSFRPIYTEEGRQAEVALVKDHGLAMFEGKRKDTVLMDLLRNSVTALGNKLNKAFTIERFGHANQDGKIVFGVSTADGFVYCTPDLNKRTRALTCEARLRVFEF